MRHDLCQKMSCLVWGLDQVQWKLKNLNDRYCEDLHGCNNYFEIIFLQKKATELFARAIYNSACPLSLTEHPDWIDLFQFLRPAFHLPSRHELSNRLLNEEYERLEEDVNSAIARATSVAVMTDSWTNVKYVEYTCNFNFKQKKSSSNLFQWWWVKPEKILLETTVSHTSTVLSLDI